MFIVLALLSAQPRPAVIPPRLPDAPGAAAMLARLAPLSPTDREDAIATAVMQGNLPEFLRTFVPVTVTVDSHTITYRVMPDYLAVGSDTDFVRVPIRPRTAQRIADAWGMTLPTRKMCDDIYRQAAVKLEPRPLVLRREAIATFVQHHEIIEKQRGDAGARLGVLVAGIKKDVVVTNRLAEKPNRVAIYGWHKLDGVPIQPLSIVHGEAYVDYSHGVRLVDRAVIVDGQPRDWREIAASNTLSPLVSDEGPLIIHAY
jgi:hypothetical protein